MKLSGRRPVRAAAIAFWLTLVVLAVPAVQADVIDLNGPLGSGAEGIGSFTGSFGYSWDGTNGIVTILLNNTTPEDAYITAFAFNLPGVDSDQNPVSITDASLSSSTDADFGLIGGATVLDSVGGSPFGQFDIGASISDEFEGGGMPQLGIGFGGSATFVFLLSGTGLDTLGAADFLNTLSVGPGDGEGNEELVVRFRGFEGGFSDKVPSDVVPEPGSLMLVGLGLVGIVASRLSRRRA